jgi:hypothetical protein
MVMFLFCLLSLIATARSAIAEVTRIEFTSKQPYGTFRAGEYVIWQGRIPRRPVAAGGHFGDR